MRLLICGGRDFADWAFFATTMLDTISEFPEISMIVHGDADGADTMAYDWAKQVGIQQVRIPANWVGEGKSAGPKRNALMLELINPDLVLAFPTPKSRGTYDMTRRSDKAGIECRIHKR